MLHKKEVMFPLEPRHVRVERLDNTALLALVLDPPDEIAEGDIFEALKEYRPRPTWEFKMSRTSSNRWMIRVTIRHKSGGAVGMTFELMYFPFSLEFAVDGSRVPTLDLAAQRIWERVRY